MNTDGNSFAGNSIADTLKEKNIKPSQQRIKILEYLAGHPCHPTVDHIYNALKPEMPVLSKSTVYNTLNLLKEVQLVRELTIEENEIHYEYCLKDHGHFQCERCRSIYDFHIDMQKTIPDGLRGFRITSKDIYFKGICSRCLDDESL